MLKQEATIALCKCNESHKTYGSVLKRFQTGIESIYLIEKLIGII